MRRRILLACLGTVGLAATMINIVDGASAPRSWTAIAVPASAAHRLDTHRFPVPPSTADCRAIYLLACYSPAQLLRAYDVDALHERGLTGRGQTIAIVDSFGSPTIEHDLQADQQSLYTYRVDSWPSSDPLVTSVGGTRLHLDADGHRTAPDEVWNDDYGAGGGGLSTMFARPAFQDGVQSVVGAQRGTPDVAMSASIDGGAIVYSSYDKDDAGWSIVGGTSEATPMFAGVVAVAAQAAGHPLGLINPALYSIAHRGDSGIVDVVNGGNTFGDVPGYDAVGGYDLASGLGSIDAGLLVPELAAAAQPAGG